MSALVEQFLQALAAGLLVGCVYGLMCVGLATAALPTILQMATGAGGPKPTRIGIVMDNTASPVSFTKSMSEGGIKALGLDLVVDEAFTAPLSDAGPIMQKVRAARPDFLLLLPTATPDINGKLSEIGLPRTRLPVVNNGGPMGSPDLLRIVAADCCFSPVLNLAEALKTPHLLQRKLVRRDGRHVQALFPALVDGEVPPMRERAALGLDRRSACGFCRHETFP
jgi:hypothetical protein